MAEEVIVPPVVEPVVPPVEAPVEEPAAPVDEPVATPVEEVEGAEGGEGGEELPKTDEKSSAAEALRLLAENKKIQPFANVGYAAAKLAEKNPEVRKAINDIMTAVSEGKDIDEAVAALGTKMKEAGTEPVTAPVTAPEAAVAPTTEREIKYALTKLSESYPQIITGGPDSEKLGKRAYELYESKGLPMMEAWEQSAREVYGNPVSIEASKFMQSTVAGLGG